MTDDASSGRHGTETSDGTTLPVAATTPDVGKPLSTSNPSSTTV